MSENLPNSPEDRAKHQIRVRTDIAATLTGLAKDYDAVLVADMTAAFLAKVLNACLLTRRMDGDQVAALLDDLVDNAYVNIKEEPKILIASGNTPTGRLH